MGEWQLQEAKARFSEVVKRAQTEGPQIVTVRGERTAFIVSADEYDRLTSGGRTAADVLLAGPEWSEEMAAAIEQRDRTLPRDIEF